MHFLSFPSLVLQEKRNVAAASLECRCILVVTHTLCPSWNTGLFSRHFEFLKQRMRGRLERGINCHYAGGPEMEEMRGTGGGKKRNIFLFSWSNSLSISIQHGGWTGEIIIASLSAITRLQCKLGDSVRYKLALQANISSVSFWLNEKHKKGKVRCFVFSQNKTYIEFVRAEMRVMSVGYSHSGVYKFIFIFSTPKHMTCYGCLVLNPLLAFRHIHLRCCIPAAPGDHRNWLQ